ncbi:MAG: preprotein translocase subunit SecG [Rhodospirillales bacterium]|nr:preprotein translocase subunit SecG [Rhodospirillales bacterium]
MVTTLLVIHLIIAVALVAVVLLQRSEGGALGIGGGGGGGMSGFLTGRSTANLLTRTTAILAALFILTSLTLAKLSGGSASRSLFEQAPLPQTTAPAPESAPPSEAPETPQTPSAPLAR